jgi:hypothetical protein
LTHLSSRALTQKLRAFATRRTNQQLGPSIRLLRAAIVAVVLAVCALSVGRYLAVDRQLNAFQVCVHHVRTSKMTVVVTSNLLVFQPKHLNVLAKCQR